MLEPLIVLTVLNCIFMFSSTVTTCALWWRYHSHRCCARRDAAQRKSDLKKSKSSTLRTARKSGKSELDVNFIDKSSTNANREHGGKRCQKKRSKKKYLEEYQKKNEEKTSHPDELDTKKLEEKMKMSEASQTANDTKSTVVMEFSTVQKVVQIVDNDSDAKPTRIPFKDIVIQKDITNKKYDCNVEQNFAANVAANENARKIVVAD